MESQLPIREGLMGIERVRSPKNIYKTPENNRRSAAEALDLTKNSKGYSNKKEKGCSGRKKISLTCSSKSARKF